MSIEKKFDYSKSDMDNIYNGINNLFALEALDDDDDDYGYTSRRSNSSASKSSKDDDDSKYKYDEDGYKIRTKRDIGADVKKIKNGVDRVSAGVNKLKHSAKILKLVTSGNVSERERVKIIAEIKRELEVVDDQLSSGGFESQEAKSNLIRTKRNLQEAYNKIRMGKVKYMTDGAKQAMRDMVNTKNKSVDKSNESVNIDDEMDYLSDLDLDRELAAIESLDIDDAAFEALSEDEEEDLEDYDPEKDSDDDIDDDDDDGDDSEIDDDADPAEDEDDEYDDVVEHVGIDNLEEFLSADELIAEDLMKTAAIESSIDSLNEAFTNEHGTADDVRAALESDVNVALTKSVLDEEHSSKFDPDSDEIYGLDFDDDDIKDEDIFDAEYFND